MGNKQDWSGLLPEEMTIANVAKHCQVHEKLNPYMVIAFTKENLHELLATNEDGTIQAIFILSNTCNIQTPSILGPDGKKPNATFSATFDYKKIDIYRTLISTSKFEAVWSASGRRHLTWFKHREKEIRKSEKEPSRIETRIETILDVVHEFGYDPLCIPYGGKSKIKKRCSEEHFALFKTAGFDHAWKEASKRKIVEVENADQYRPKKITNQEKDKLTD